MLPLGRKNARKCTECGITCHATCTHFVPDFCGMTMETANALLANIRDIKRTHQNKRSITSMPLPPINKPNYSQYEDPYQQDPLLRQRMEGLDLNREDYPPPQSYPQSAAAPPERQQTQTPVEMYNQPDTRYGQGMPPPQPAMSAPQPFSPPGPPPPIQSNRISQPPPPGSQGRIPIPFQPQVPRPGQPGPMDQQPYGVSPLPMRMALHHYLTFLCSRASLNRKSLHDATTTLVVLLHKEGDIHQVLHCLSSNSPPHQGQGLFPLQPHKHPYNNNNSNSLYGSRRGNGGSGWTISTSLLCSAKEISERSCLPKRRRLPISMLSKS